MEELDSHRQPASRTEGCSDSLGRGKLPPAASPVVRVLFHGSPGLADLPIRCLPDLTRYVGMGILRHSFAAALGEKPMDRPIGVVVVANDLTGRVDSPSVSEYRAREVEKREIILGLEKPMDRPAGIGVGA